MKKKRPYRDRIRNKLNRKAELRRLRRAPILRAAGYKRKVGRFKLARIRRRAPTPAWSDARAQHRHWRAKLEG